MYCTVSHFLKLRETVKVFNCILLHLWREIFPHSYAYVSSLVFQKKTNLFKLDAQKMKIFIKDFFSKSDQIRWKQQIWSHLLKKSLVERFIFLQCQQHFLSPLEVFSKKLLRFSESSLKIKVRSYRTFFVILLTSEVIFKQRLLHGNEIVQCFQNYKCYCAKKEVCH